MRNLNDKEILFFFIFHTFNETFNEVLHIHCMAQNHEFYNAFLIIYLAHKNRTKLMQ